MGVIDDSSRATLASRARGWLPVIIAAGVLAIAGVVAIPLGGWDRVWLESAAVPIHPVGEPFAAARLTTSIDDAYLTDVSPDGYSEAEPGDTFLVVVATMEATGSEPQDPFGYGSFFTFVIFGIQELGDDVPNDLNILLERDGTFGPYLSPGVPDTMLFIYPVGADEFTGGNVLRVGLTDGTPEKADIYEGIRWVNQHIAVLVDVPIRDVR